MNESTQARESIPGAKARGVAYHTPASDDSPKIPVSPYGAVECTRNLDNLRLLDGSGAARLDLKELTKSVVMRRRNQETLPSHKLNVGGSALVH